MIKAPVQTTPPYGHPSYSGGENRYLKNAGGGDPM